MCINRTRVIIVIIVIIGVVVIVAIVICIAIATDVQTVRVIVSQVSTVIHAVCASAICRFITFTVIIEITCIGEIVDGE